MNDDMSKVSGAKRSGADTMNEVRLRAARKRRAESRDQEDAIDGLREIAATFLGSEEIGLFRVNREGTSFQVIGSFGIKPEESDRLRAGGKPRLGRSVR